MHIYLSPLADEQHLNELRRIREAEANVQVLHLGFQHKTTVQQAVHQLSDPKCRGLLLPDDYRRHNDLIEHAKACAHHIGIPVEPLGRYLARRNSRPTPTAAQPPGRATPEPAAVGGSTG